MNTPASSGRGDSAKQQSLRQRRLVLGSMSYLLTLTLVVIRWYLGYFAAPVMLTYVAMVPALNAFFFLAIKTDFNLRFADPSVTLMQICLSTLPGLYVMYHARQSRRVPAAVRDGCHVRPVPVPPARLFRHDAVRRRRLCSADRAAVLPAAR